ncbi:MAG: DNA adenine methylase [Kiritimatiellales bacterium]
MKSPISYLGGKSLLAKQIVSMMPKHKAYIEPFCGAAWVFFEKEPSEVEVLNDMNLELVTFWRVVQNHLEEFLRHFKHCVISREIFDILNRTDTSTLTDVQRAVCFFYLQKMGYGGKTKGRTLTAYKERPPSLNLLTLEESILDVHWRMQKVMIERMDAVQCIQRYDTPDSLFYIDPPYYGHEKDYAVTMPREKFEEINACLSGVKGRFILSLNDVAAVRKIFAGFKIKSISTRYTASTGTGNRDKDRPEVLITNF